MEMCRLLVVCRCGKMVVPGIVSVGHNWILCYRAQYRIR